MASPSSAGPSLAHEQPRWARRWLLAAGIYNLLWGGVVIALPHLFFDLAGMPRSNYPQIWQCVGMIVGVYGIGYLVASRDHRRHWPIVLVGLLGKIFGPIGFAHALWRGDFPPAFGLTILTNDLLWWVPFSMMLWDAAKHKDAPPPGAPVLGVREALTTTTDARGVSLLSRSEARPTLVVLTRHAGCTFCRKTLGQLRTLAPTLRERGVTLAIVTMSSDAENVQLARRYDLTDAAWCSDPDRTLYRALELGRGSFTQLFGLRALARGAVAFLRGHGLGGLHGDGFQMPGTFLIHRGTIQRAFRHASAGDRPDYAAMACPIETPAGSGAPHATPEPARA